jgi:hypothetical protein
MQFYRGGVESDPVLRPFQGPLFDHLVGERKQCRRHLDVEQLGGFQLADLEDDASSPGWTGWRPWPVANRRAEDAGVSACVTAAGAK